MVIHTPSRYILAYNLPNTYHHSEFSITDRLCQKVKNRHTVYVGQSFSSPKLLEIKVAVVDIEFPKRKPFPKLIFLAYKKEEDEHSLPKTETTKPKDT
jgi:hypothetical protein